MSPYFNGHNAFEISVAFYKDFLADEIHPIFRNDIEQFKKSFGKDPVLVGIVTPAIAFSPMGSELIQAGPNGCLINSHKFKG
jgi:hypothetical protein